MFIIAKMLIYDGERLYTLAVNDYLRFVESDIVNVERGDRYDALLISGKSTAVLSNSKTILDMGIADYADINASMMVAEQMILILIMRGTALELKLECDRLIAEHSIGSTLSI